MVSQIDCGFCQMQSCLKSEVVVKVSPNNVVENQLVRKQNGKQKEEGEKNAQAQANLSKTVFVPLLCICRCLLMSIVLYNSYVILTRPQSFNVISCIIFYTNPLSVNKKDNLCLDKCVAFLLLFVYFFSSSAPTAKVKEKTNNTGTSSFTQQSDKKIFCHFCLSFRCLNFECVCYLSILKRFHRIITVAAPDKNVRILYLSFLPLIHLQIESAACTRLCLFK